MIIITMVDIEVVVDNNKLRKKDYCKSEITIVHFFYSPKSFKY